MADASMYASLVGPSNDSNKMSAKRHPPNSSMGLDSSNDRKETSRNQQHASSPKNRKRSGDKDNNSIRKIHIPVSEPTQHPSDGATRREEIDYDRLQIRKKLRGKLEARGDHPCDAVEKGDDEDLYEDDGTELFPWKQREAAVVAAATGGKTESRIEGFDSLERAIQADKHKLHYGRGRGFGWSNQKTSQNVDTSLRRQVLTDWDSFRHLRNSIRSLGSGGEGSKGSKKDVEAPELVDFKRERTFARQRQVRKIVYIFAALLTIVGFSFLMEKIKLDKYESYIPDGSSQVPRDTSKPVDASASRPADNNVEQQRAGIGRPN